MVLPAFPLQQTQLVPLEPKETQGQLVPLVPKGQLVPLEPKELLARQGCLELPVLLERLRRA